MINLDKLPVYYQMMESKPNEKKEIYRHIMNSPYHLSKQNKPTVFFKVISKIICFEYKKRKDI